MSKKSKAAERAERAAAALREQRRRERRRNVLTGAAIVAVMIAVVGGGFAVNTLRDDSAEVGGAAPAAGQSDYAVTIGEPDAPAEVVIYEDFLCPFCAGLEAATAERLSDLAEEGKVLVDYRPFILLAGFGDYSERSADAFGVVLEQSGPEVAKEFHDLLFAEQPPEAGPYPDDDWLVDRAVEAGAEEADVRAGIEADTGDWAQAATEEADAAGVRSTPTILLDGAVFTDGRTVEELADNLISRLE